MIEVHRTNGTKMDPVAQDGALVELPYTLHDRYFSIAIAWTIILFPPLFLNLALFYGLWYGTTLSHKIVLAIPSAIFGVATAINVFFRVRKLISRSPQYRPLNSPRWALDPFQWGYNLGIVLVTAELVSGLAVPGGPYLRVLAMAGSTLMFELAVLALISLILHAAHAGSPFQLGSIPAGERVRPVIYYIVEDVVAVDGGGGIEYRRAFNARYTSSVRFQKMIYWLTVMWMLGFFFVGAGVTGAVFGVGKREIAYGIGWGAPFLGAGLMVLSTVWYVKRCLRKDKNHFGTEL